MVIAMLVKVDHLLFNFLMNHLLLKRSRINWLGRDGKRNGKMTLKIHGIATKNSFEVLCLQSTEAEPLTAHAVGVQYHI